MSRRRATRWARPGGILSILLFLGVGASFGAAGAGAQETSTDVRPGWLPWLGCWEAVDDEPDVRDGAVGSVVCLRPAPGGDGVEIVGVRDGRIDTRETLRADGRRRRSVREGCRGWERGSVSEVGRRIYLRSEHVCPGEVERTGAALLSMVSPYEWVEVRTLRVEGTGRTWVRRYRLLSPGERSDRLAGTELEGLAVDGTMAVESARIAAAEAPGVDDVIDASASLPAATVAAWIAEQSDPLELDADALLRMSDAGVPDRVVDVALAVSYPDRFVVRSGARVEERDVGPRARPGERGRRARPMYGAGGWYGWSGYYRPYRPYRLFDPFYSPWSYGAFGYGYRGYGYRPGLVYVVPRDRLEEDRGRVVNGRGYTRGGSDDASVRRPRSGPPRSGGASSSAGRGGSRGGSVSAGGGYRGGSETGRTARPRGGGEDEGGGEGEGGGSGHR